MTDTIYIFCQLDNNYYASTLFSSGSDGDGEAAVAVLVATSCKQRKNSVSELS